MKVCNSVGVWLFLIGVAFGATPIQDLKLIDSANGNKVAFTNLGSVSVGSGTTVTTISSNLITVSGNIMPGASNTYDIGSSNMPFRQGYFGTNALYLGPYLMGVNSNGSLTYNGYPFVSTGGVSIAAQDGVITGGQNNVRLGTNVTTTGDVIVGGGLRQTAETISFSNTATDNFGLQSAAFPVSGQTFSTWLGFDALYGSSGAEVENTAMGYLAGYNSPGNYKSAMGTYALAYAAGSYNIAIGSDALRGAPGNYNIAMGYFAGYFAGGESNTFLGYQAARSAGNITNAIVIGANSVPLGNNSTVIGNAQTTNVLIHGTVRASGGFLGSLTLTNGTTISDGVLNGTNGIYFTPRGSTTNYWITFP